MSFGSLQDSGNRTDYGTGGLRDRPGGKGRFDLISPLALERLAKHYEAGCLKYSPRNWEQGLPVSCFIDSAMRHLCVYLSGDTSEDHLAAAMWNAAGAIHIEHKALCGELPAALLDLPRHAVPKSPPEPPRDESPGRGEWVVKDAEPPRDESPSRGEWVVVKDAAGWHVCRDGVLAEEVLVRGERRKLAEFDAVSYVEWDR